jgi:hypothetical protein
LVPTLDLVLGCMTVPGRLHCRLQATGMAQQEAASSRALALVLRWRQRMATGAEAAPPQVLAHLLLPASHKDVFLELGRDARQVAARALH